MYSNGGNGGGQLPAAPRLFNGAPSNGVGHPHGPQGGVGAYMQGGVAMIGAQSIPTRIGAQGVVTSEQRRVVNVREQRIGMGYGGVPFEMQAGGIIGPGDFYGAPGVAFRNGMQVQQMMPMVGMEQRGIAPPSDDAEGWSDYSHYEKIGIDGSPGERVSDFDDPPENYPPAQQFGVSGRSVYAPEQSDAAHSRGAVLPAPQPIAKPSQGHRNIFTMDDEFDLLRRIEKAHTLASQLEGAAKPKSLGTDNSSSSNVEMKSGASAAPEVKGDGMGAGGAKTESVEEYSEYKVVGNEGQEGGHVGSVSSGGNGEVRGPDGRLLC